MLVSTRVLSAAFAALNDAVRESASPNDPANLAVLSEIQQEIYRIQSEISILNTDSVIITEARVKLPGE